MDLVDRARAALAGGVSSPARAFGAVGGDPLFARGGQGAYLEDADGRRYVDFIQGFGSVILGHAHPRVQEAVVRAAAKGGGLGLSTPDEVELAELIVQRVPTIERVRFTTSGTEASMTAARIARAATGRELIVKFEGCYHGHADPFLARAGSGVATFGIPSARGVPASAVRSTVVLPYNDTEALKGFFAEHGEEVAAVFVEPVAANMGVVWPEPGFLEGIVDLCRKAGSVSVFDEVVTGFRLGPGGAQAALGLFPDLTMLGKVIGGGLPVGALGGRAELMELLAPSGPVYQAGTYAAHPHAMAAGLAVLRALESGVYAELEAKAARLAGGLAEAAPGRASIVRATTFLSLFFAPTPPRSFAEVQAADLEAFSRFHRALRRRGVLVPPSPFEVWFPSLAHGDAEIERTVEAAAEAFGEVE